MGRAARVAFPGAKYHTMARGNWRAEIFSSPGDYTRFLMQLRDAALNEGVIIFAYALMNNHYHLFIETPQGNVSRFMQRLNTAYSLYFRNRTQKPGHCFQGRYACQLVSGNDYCLRLTRYIHLNPIKTSHFEHASATQKWAALNRFEWTSLPGYLDAAHALDWIDYRWLDLCGGATPRSQAAEYSSSAPIGAPLDFSGPDTQLPPPPDPRPAQRQVYARYLAGCIDGDDNLVREDNDTGQLLDVAHIGEEEPAVRMPNQILSDREGIVGCQAAENSSSAPFGAPLDFSGPDTRVPSHPTQTHPAAVSGLEKSGWSAAESGVFNGLTPDRSMSTDQQPEISPALPVPARTLPFDIITHIVAQAFDLKESALFAHGLHAAVAKATAIELACRFTGLSQCDVAARFGYRSESSIGKQRKRLQTHMEAATMRSRFMAAEQRLREIANE